jgi:hypothetical protein
MSLKLKKGSKQWGRKHCKAKTKAGSPCQAPAVEGGLCFCHAHPERLAELGRQGGQKNRHWKREECDLPTIPLKSIEEISELLEETINRVRQGSLDPRAANTLGFLAGIHLKVLAQRVEAPETNREASAGIYMSLFQRLGSAPPQEKVYDRFPQPQPQAETTVPAALPAPGEFIDDTPTRPNTHPRVITVEVG